MSTSGFKRQIHRHALACTWTRPWHASTPDANLVRAKRRGARTRRPPLQVLTETGSSDAASVPRLRAARSRATCNNRCNKAINGVYKPHDAPKVCTARCAGSARPLALEV